MGSSGAWPGVTQPQMGLGAPWVVFFFLAELVLE